MQLSDSAIDGGGQIDAFLDVEGVHGHGFQCRLVLRALLTGLDNEITKTAYHMGGSREAQVQGNLPMRLTSLMGHPGGDTPFHGYDYSL